MAQIFKTGNSFDYTNTSYGHARKVWRRIEEQLPGGFRVKNITDFTSAGLIRSGLAIVKDTTTGADAKDVKVLTWTQLKTAINGTGGIDAAGIIGFLQEDIPVTDSNTYATANVIVKGEIYGYMLGDTAADATTISAAVKGMAQKNGLNIRVVD